MLLYRKLKVSLTTDVDSIRNIKRKSKLIGILLLNWWTPWLFISIFQQWESQLFGPNVDIPSTYSACRQSLQSLISFFSSPANDFFGRSGSWIHWLFIDLWSLIFELYRDQATHHDLVFESDARSNLLEIDDGSLRALQFNYILLLHSLALFSFYIQESLLRTGLSTLC